MSGEEAGFVWIEDFGDEPALWITAWKMRGAVTRNIGNSSLTDCRRVRNLRFLVIPQ